MPVRDPGLAHLPAKQNDFVVDLAGKIQQPGIEVFHLDADRVDLLHRIFRALDMGFHLGALAGDLGDIDMHSAGDVNALGKILQLIVDPLRGAFCFDGALEQRLEHRNKCLCFVESE